MSVAQGEKLLTIEEFSRLPNEGPRVELVRGRLVEVNQPKPRHGQVCAKIGRVYGNVADENELGHVLTNDTGVITGRDPDTVRGADVMFFSFARLPKGPLPNDYLPIAPDFVFEVFSADDRWAKVEEKVAEYLAAGVAVVCVAHPETETVHVFRSESAVQKLSGNDELVLPEFAEDFRVCVMDFFS